MSDIPKPIEVFFSYADKDEPLRNELEKHLSSLRRQGRIAGWHHRHVAPGTDLTRAIDAYLERASIILLLISADFLDSNYCYGIEMQRALQRHAAKQARVIPILLRPVDWKGAPFAKLQVLPNGGLPITKWGNQDDAFVDVVVGISQAIEDFAHPSIAPAPTPGTVLKSPAGHTVLGTGDVTIGRTSDNTYMINDSQTSGHHAVIRSHSQGYAIVDLKSRNGTFVNGQALSPEMPRVLRRGDAIRVGNTTFEYRDGILVEPIVAAPTALAPEALMQATPLPKAPDGNLVAPIPPAPPPETPMYPTPLPDAQVSATPVYSRPAVPMFQPPSLPTVIGQLQKRSTRGLWITLIVIGTLALFSVILSVIGYAYRTTQNSPATATSANSPATATSASTIPQLKPSYSGTATATAKCTNCSPVVSVVLRINSEDQRGDITSATFSGGGGDRNCTGTVEAGGPITLQCQNVINATTGGFSFRGTVESDGHIEGTQVFTISGNTFDVVLR